MPQDSDQLSSTTANSNLGEESGLNDGNRPNFPVVGIGASAGGLEAFKNLFQAMPVDSGMAFVLVQHLDPTHESMMTGLLSKYTDMRVLEIKDGMALVPNTVYMIPPNKYLLVRNGHLSLTEPVVRRGMRLPIDYFFRSMAEELAEKAICIVLSGTGSDGTLGIKAIKGEGGAVFAQEPTTAQYDGMPRSAIATGIVDFVLPVEKMPPALLGYVHHTLDTTIDTPPPSKDQPNGIQSILSLLKVRTNHDFRCYKQGTLTRRILRRMGLKQLDRFQDYLDLLRNDEKEVKALLRDLLIGVTSFFRDPSAWKNLEEYVVAPLVANKAPNEHIRVWVPGCSSGEEAYSLAILIAEIQTKTNNTSEVQIFASDIDEHALEAARNGVYPESIAADVSSFRLQTYFVAEEGFYRVNKTIRDMVVFANQNLVRDPPFSKVDLISCRNLLIYLDSAIQKRIISLLHFALNDKGYLFLGSSESVSQQTDLFEVLSKKSRLYRRIGVAQIQSIEFPLIPGDEDSREKPVPGLPREPRPGSVSALAHELLLREYVPALALVNRRGEAIYYHGPIANYLEFSAGEPTRDIAEQAKEGLSLKVRSVQQRAFREKATVSATGRKRNEPDSPPVLIVARPLEKLGSAEGLLLLTFEDQITQETAAPPVSGDHQPDELLQLEYELNSTREDLQSTIEELETSNEELKASNEEVMSMNEELQSSNEELETSKEELQSLNEELTTVNNQLQDKVQELELATNDMANLLNGTNVATLFLDRNLRVRRFTPNTTKLFRLIPTDVGRSIEDIVLRFKGENLIGDVHSVLSNLQPLEVTIQTEDGCYFLNRIQPYRTEDDRIYGVVLTFVDVTDLKRMETDLRINEERWRFALESNEMGAWSLKLDDLSAWRSKKHDQIFGIHDSTVDWNYTKFLKFVVPEDRDKVDSRFKKALKEKSDWMFECRITRTDGALRWISAKGRHFEIGHGNAGRMLGLVADITPRKVMELDLIEKEKFIKQVMNASLAGVYLYDRKQGRNLYINQRYTKITGYTKRDLNILSADEFAALFHPDDANRVMEHMIAISTLAEDQILPIEYRFKHKDGHWIWCLSGDVPFLRDEDGEVIQFMGTFLDVTEQKNFQAQIIKSEETHRLAMNAAREGLWDWNLKTNEVYYNPAFGQIIGEDHIGTNDKAWINRINSADRDKVLRSLNSHLQGATSDWEAEHRLKNKSGGWTWVRGRGKVVARSENGEPARMIGTLEDISIYKENEKQIWHQANYDSLTLLPNRNLFNELLNKEIERADRNQHQIWVMFLDLDGFKEINDSLGHKAGDELLEKVATRIQRNVRNSDIVARLGGDEFVIVLSSIPNQSEVDLVASKLIQTVRKPCQINNQEINITASIGIANFPKDAKTFDQLLMCADQSMYASKKEGKNRYTYFTAALQHASRLRMQISTDIRAALKNDDFQLYFQPIANLQTGQVCKAEALIRWNHPHKGMINPEVFIPLAEETGLIMDISETVIKKAIATLLHWQQINERPFQLSINLSPIQLKLKSDQSKEWINHFRNAQLKPGSIILEITEGVIVTPEESVNQCLLIFKDLGIDVAIDDFGTGYSSLAYLKEFHIDYLKIDQSFVKDLDTGTRSESLCESIIAMAHKLGMKVVAEGIETETQNHMLQAMGCDFGQGFYLSKPIPADRFEREFISGAG